MDQVDESIEFDDSGWADDERANDDDDNGSVNYFRSESEIENYFNPMTDIRENDAAVTENELDCIEDHNEPHTSAPSPPPNPTDTPMVFVSEDIYPQNMDCDVQYSQQTEPIVSDESLSNEEEKGSVGQFPITFGGTEVISVEPPDVEDHFQSDEDPILSKLQKIHTFEWTDIDTVNSMFNLFDSIAGEENLNQITQKQTIDVWVLNDFEAVCFMFIHVYIFFVDFPLHSHLRLRKQYVCSCGLILSMRSLKLGNMIKRFPLYCMIMV